MSYVHVMIVKDDCVYWVNVHYRTAMKLLEKGVDKVLPLLKSQFLDSGYLVFDVNRKVVVNGQGAFPVGKVLGKNDLCVIET